LSKLCLSVRIWGQTTNSHTLTVPNKKNNKRGL
jgi:hypothetical protein